MRRQETDGRESDDARKREVHRLSYGKSKQQDSSVLCQTRRSCQHKSLSSSRGRGGMSSVQGRHARVLARKRATKGTRVGTERAKTPKRVRMTGWSEDKGDLYIGGPCRRTIQCPRPSKAGIDRSIDGSTDTPHRGRGKRRRRSSKVVNFSIDVQQYNAPPCIKKG